MPYIGKVALPAPTLDHKLKAFDATEELILIGQDHAFVAKGSDIIGILCLDHLLEQYKKADISGVNVEEFVEPIFYVNEYDYQRDVARFMNEKLIEHIAVKNKAGNFVGIASTKQLSE